MRLAFEETTESIKDVQYMKQKAGALQEKSDSITLPVAASIQNEELLDEMEIVYDLMTCYGMLGDNKGLEQAMRKQYALLEEGKKDS